MPADVSGEPVDRATVGVDAGEDLADLGVVLPELLDVACAARRGHLDRFGFGLA